MDWNDVRYFLALARLGSVRAAGAALGVSHSTVARRIEALEEQLATRLFDRSRDGYTLTDAGEGMRPSAERVEVEMAAIERRLVGQDTRLAGLVALTCCDDWVARIALRVLRPLCDTHPGIELGVSVDSRLFDLSKREADVAIRAMRCDAQPPAHLIGTRVAPLVIANYVGAAHAKRLSPEHAGGATRWIAFDDPKTMDALVAGSSYPDVPFWGAFASIGAMTHAAREGLGLVMLPTYVGDQEPGLSRLDQPDLRHMADLWLLSHPDLRDNARLRAVRACLIDGFRDHAALFGGDGWSSDVTGRPEFATPDGETAGVH